MKIPAPKNGFTKIQSLFSEFFGLGRAATITTITFIGCLLLAAIFWFIYSAPPRTLIISSGPEGSSFRKNADKYAAILQRHNVKLIVLPSEGSQENLKRLADHKFKVDIGFVQGGINTDAKIDKLISLGSMFYQPLYVFYRSSKTIDTLSRLKGKRVAIGPEGTGTRILALTLLSLNGIKPGEDTRLLDLDADDAAAALLQSKVDAVFLTGDSAPVQIMRTLMRAPNIHLFNVAQAEGYARRIHYLSTRKLPKGSLDFGKNIPSQDVALIGPTIELIARSNLHPALSDLLLEVAREVHGAPSLLRNLGEFPSPIAYEIPLSEEASRYYKSGKGFLYRYLPFWQASLANRVLVVFIPFILILIPGIKMIPALYRWRINLGIYRWYRALLRIEQDVISGSITGEILAERLDQIEQAVNRMKVPASFAEQFYVLKQHIEFVRERILDGACKPEKIRRSKKKESK
ncbi:MAG: TAXI family TRAP transporter solute-binding subunit [Nitrospirota bacterium]